MNWIKSNKLDKTLVVDGVITLLIMGMIFAFSAQDATESSALSDGLAYRIIDGVRSFIPGMTMDTMTFVIRKMAHFTEYTVLGIFVTRTAQDVRRLVESAEQKGAAALRNAYTKAWSLGIIYATSDEYHQYFVPGRACQFRDVCIDSAGVLLGVLLVWCLSGRRKGAKEETTEK